MQSLVLEGGTFRPIFSAGVMDALLEENIMFPYCIGVSAGICNGTSYVSKQKGRNLEVLLKYRNDNRYISRRNFLRCRSIFGLDFAFGEVVNHLVPFDMKTFLQYEGKFLVGITNAKTAEVEYLNGKDIDEKYLMLRATCALPVLFPAIHIGANKYFDGGLRDPIPIRKAVEDGNQKHLIILTRPKGYKKATRKNDEMVARLLKFRYPKISQLIQTRHTEYNETVKYCEQLEKEKKAIILRPEYHLQSFESDLTKIQKGYDHGYQMAKKRMEEIRSIF